MHGTTGMMLRKTVQKWREKIMDNNRLEAFENMLAAVQREYDDILSKMEVMTKEGKVKSVTYRQMMTRRSMYQNMISIYQIYGLV